MIQINALSVGPLQVNCYTVATGTHFYIIDPGADGASILAHIAEHNTQALPEQVLLTHAHFDHIGGCGTLHRERGIPIALAKADGELYASPLNAMEPFFPRVTDLPPVEAFPDDPDFDVIATPGHSPGSVCFYFPKDKALFSGDTLFCQGVGRTDLPFGNAYELMRSLREKVMQLPDDVRVYPGHGPETTIGDERKLNPYLNFPDF